MKANTRYLAGLWAVVIPMGALLAISFGTALLAGQFGAVIFPISVMLVLIVLIKGWVRWRLRKAFRADSPEPLAVFFQRTIRPGLMPDGDALQAHACAIAYLLHADYAAARAALQKVTWGERPPLIRAARKSVDALLCYFDTREYADGLDLALLAQELGAIPSSFPGAKKALAAYESFVEIGEVLCGRTTPVTLESLERKMKVLPPMVSLFAAWGLAVAHHQLGNAARVEHFMAFIRDTAPHCRALALPVDVSARQP